MLRKIRIALAAFFFVGITLLFVGIGHDWWGWMAKLQFLPSALALNLVVVGIILLANFLFGRVYCSTICPMGVFQDIIIWLRRTIGKWQRNRGVRKLQHMKERGIKPGPEAKNLIKHFEHKYHPERRWVRYNVFVLSLVSIFVSGQMLIALIAPYSAYGRVVRSIVGVASGSVAVPLLLTGLLTLVIIFVCAWLWGREYCNTVCPVGTTLSLVSRFALFRPTIDTSKCVNCARCGKACKASCIDTANHKIDYSRCVVCFDCLENCSEGAIKYRFVGLGKRNDDKATDGGRRAFMTATALVGTALAAKAQQHNQGGLANVVPKQNPERGTRLVPYGAGGEKAFYSHCTACQLCVSACPNGVLRPSTDFEHFMQPEMGYEKGYCRPECNACSQVCPAGAIRPVRKGEKQTIQIGLAHVNLALCLAAQCESTCGNFSALHCAMRS